MREALLRAFYTSPTRSCWRQLDCALRSIELPAFARMTADASSSLSRCRTPFNDLMVSNGTLSNPPSRSRFCSVLDFDDHSVDRTPDSFGFGVPTTVACHRYALVQFN